MKGSHSGENDPGLTWRGLVELRRTGRRVLRAVRGARGSALGALEPPAGLPAFYRAVT